MKLSLKGPPPCAEIEKRVFMPLIPLCYGRGSAKSLQSCPALCNPMDCSLSGSSVHGILQARILGSSGDLPDPGIEPTSLMSPALLL